MSVKKQVEKITTEVATAIAMKYAAALDAKIKAAKAGGIGKVTAVDGANVTVELADGSKVKALAVGDRPIGTKMPGIVVGGRFLT